MWLWWIANLISLLVVVPLVVLLANRVIRPAVEISRYSDDILEHGVLLTENLEPVPVLADTVELGRGITKQAVRYVTALHRAI
jgi:hypothetical protein